MKTPIALAALAIALIPASLSASAKSKAPAATTAYECSTCHMHFTAAMARKDHFKDPMDGGKLIAIKAPSKCPKASPHG